MPFLRFSRTGRGFRLWEFRDFYGVASSLQQSSLAYPGAIWLGADYQPANLNYPEDNLSKNYRMHLSQDQVRELLPILIHFAETGDVLTEEELNEQRAESPGKSWEDLANSINAMEEQLTELANNLQSMKGDIARDL